MKSKVVNSIINNIKKHYDYSEERIEEIKYGIEGMYLTITKTIIIFLICILIGTIKQALLVTLFYSILRITGFGLHAKKSWQCWVTSLIFFITIPYICKFIIIPNYIKIALLIIQIIIIYIWAPADTEKRPLVNSKKRMKLKILTTITCIIYSLIAYFTNNQELSTIIVFSITIQIIMILPISYKIFGLKYNNYKEYIKA